MLDEAITFCPASVPSPRTHQTQLQPLVVQGQLLRSHLVEVPVEGVFIVDYSGNEGEHQSPAAPHLSMACNKSKFENDLNNGCSSSLILPRCWALWDTEGSAVTAHVAVTLQMPICNAYTSITTCTLNIDYVLASRHCQLCCWLLRFDAALHYSWLDQGLFLGTSMQSC